MQNPYLPYPVRIDDITVEAEDKKAAFEAAKAVCLEQARRKGISSVTRILLLKGKVSESDYVDCMEASGFAELE